MITSAHPPLADWFAAERGADLIAAAARYQLLHVARRAPKLSGRRKGRL